ncbi:hypothetical protein [Cupriavidus sp. IDO]|uniref:hypothetical protein n=1 Tax=Cupriavidus sp. IDO TaxID=1539142 RepID=UPI00057912E5|nr:hypothetical protein [Cupriavidus sp. IDO]KWR81113.1 hypothetical protein RM96_29455 [Cupriavidus sp. IDO]
MNGDKELPAAKSMRGNPGSEVVWTNSIVAADQALEEAVTIQRRVQRNLKLQQEVDALCEELRQVQAELHSQRGMHVSAVSSLRQLEKRHAEETARLREEVDLWQVRHRIYKVLAEHYALVLLRFSAEKLSEHRDRLFQHIRFHKRRGQRLSEIGAAEIVSMLR